MYISFKGAHAHLIHAYAYPKFDYSDGPNSNGHNSLNLSPNQAKFVFKLKPRMSTFQFNKPHSKIICGSKVMVKKKRAKVIFQHCFQGNLSTFEL